VTLTSQTPIAIFGLGRMGALMRKQFGGHAIHKK